MKIPVKIAALVITIAIVGLCFFMFSRTGGSKIRNVLLISMDTTRADHLSCYGFERTTTPAIDALASQGVLYENAISCIPLTLPAHCTMLTGGYPPFHNVHDNLNESLSEQVVTLPEMLKEKGYATGAVISTFVLDSQFGTAQGFDYYNDTIEESVGPREGKDRRGEDATRHAIKWLEENKDKPFFFFLHYYDPHTKYEPPEPFAAEYADDLYAGEIAYTDHCISKVIEKLRQLDLYDSTLIIVLGDHGEGLGEHGELEHGYYIYQQMVHVPFIIKGLPDTEPGRIKQAVSIVDVTPTILGALGLEIPEYMQGVDLSGPDSLNTEQKRHVYCESLTPTRYGCNPLLGIVNDQWKFIDTTRPELYNHQNDPAEKENLIEPGEKRARLLKARLNEMTTEMVGTAQSGEVTLDEQTRKKLESLGYVGVGDSLDVDYEMDQGKPDPKDYIEFHEGNQRIIYLLYYQEFDKAKNICDRLLKDWADLPNTYFIASRVHYTIKDYHYALEYGHEYIKRYHQLQEQGKIKESSNLGKSSFYMIYKFIAGSYAALEDYEKAKVYFAKMLELQPNSPEVLDQLATVHFNTKDYEKAIENWTKLAQMPEPGAHVFDFLGRAYFKLEENEKALEAWQRCLQLDPSNSDIASKINALKRKIRIAQLTEQYQAQVDKNPDDAAARNELARLYYSDDNFSGALRQWQKVIELQPENAAVYNNLAWLLAAHNSADYHNPETALEYAQKACELTEYKNAGMLDTLGVAYAANGDYARAIETAEKALKIADTDQVKQELQKHLEMYKQDKPYYEDK